MPDVRRRDLGDAMGQAVAGIAGGLANGGSTAITQIRDMTSTGGGSSSGSSSLGSIGGTGIEYDSGPGYQLAGIRLLSGAWIVKADGAGYPGGTTGYLRLNLRTGSYSADLTDTSTSANAYGAWVSGMPEATASIVDVFVGPILVTAVVTWEGGFGTATSADISAIRIA